MKTGGCLGISDESAPVIEDHSAVWLLKAARGNK